jgi:glucosamine-6-phosphate deaminase
MGVKTLTEARDILLLAAGEEKAAAVYQMLYARTSSYVPAAYLQIPLNVTVLLDQEAAKMII